MRLLLAILFLSALCASAKVVYVDKAATGANNGTSWVDAYTSLAPLDRNAGNIAAGDSVWVRGGDYPETSGFTLQEGSAGNWTHYYFTNWGSATPVKIYHGLGVRHYTEIMAGDPAYEANITNTFTAPLLTNNCYLWIYRHTNWYGVGSGGRSLIIAGDPVVIQWVHITGTTNVYTPVKSDSASEIYEDLTFSGDSATSNTLKHIWIDQSSGHGAGAAITIADQNHTDPAFNRFNVTYSLFENNGSDVCNINGGGLEYAHNIIRRRQGLGAQGCNDTFTISGDTAYNRIHHNLVEPADNSVYYLWGASGVIHDFYFYCNELTPVPPDVYNTDPNSGALINNQGSGVQEQDVFTGPMYVIASNVVFALNTIPFTTNDGPNAIVSLISKNAASTGYTNGLTVYTNAYLLLDNLSVQFDPGPLLGLPYGPFSLFCGSTSGYGTNDAGQGWYYNSNSFVLDYNQSSSYYPGNAVIATWGSSYTNWSGIRLTNSADVQRVVGYTHNSTSPVTFEDPAHWNFRPLSTDIGTNLAGLLALMPEVDKDLSGRTRVTWMGAEEPSGNVLHFDFSRADGWTTNGVLTDRSGSGNTGYKYASTGRETWPTWTNGPGTLDAARFTNNLIDGSGFHKGTYIVVPLTNSANQSLWTFTNGTWALWAEVDLDYALGYSGDEQFLTTGQDTNNWFFGNYYSTASTSGPQFSRASTTGGQEPMDTFSRWPNVTASDWHHYAITWDGSTMQAYYDGQLWNHGDGRTYTNANTFNYTTNFTGLLVSTNSVGLASSWIALGVNTHSGTPDPDDVDGLPNNGQLQGALADVRIYNRALSAAEIGAIYSATNGGGSNPTPPASNGRVVFRGKSGHFKAVYLGQ